MDKNVSSLIHAKVKKKKKKHQKTVISLDRKTQSLFSN